ncbi:hypothetical protein [Alkalihalobacillus sp. CinArs1]|uniref:hypothetical protein n=1 Tax=Alkalihalobacillus sp. CinArs1 TaxID=2995314 RepID=UPI0022DDF82E|nr:hypothetical protein [Alkalihalobacillus sp. CinArs1]
MAGFIFALITVGCLLLLATVNRLLMVRKYSFYTEQIIQKKRNAFLFGTFAIFFLLLGVSMAFLVL